MSRWNLKKEANSCEGNVSQRVWKRSWVYQAELISKVMTEYWAEFNNLAEATVTTHLPRFQTPFWVRLEWPFHGFIRWDSLANRFSKRGKDMPQWATGSDSKSRLLQQGHSFSTRGATLYQLATNTPRWDLINSTTEYSRSYLFVID